MLFNFNPISIFWIMEQIQVLVFNETCFEYNVLGAVSDIINDTHYNRTNHAEYQLDLAPHNNLSLCNAAILLGTY